MRIVQLNRWEFDIPSGDTLIVSDYPAALWIDSLQRDNEKLRAEVYKRNGEVIAAWEERDRLRSLIVRAYPYLDERTPQTVLNDARKELGI